MIAEKTEIRPQAGPQEAFLSTPADIAIYGGAAGGGKTWALLMEPLRHVAHPDFGAVIFRRTYKQVVQEGGMWDETERLYPLVGAQGIKGDLYWSFPSGSRVAFAHLQHESDKHNYQGAQIALLGFDQLEHFSESMFFYMLSRNRSLSGIRPYVRVTCNPDADSWLADFLAWWIDQETGYAIPERGGAVRWFVRASDAIVWADTREEMEAKYPDNPPKSVTFIPASVQDNKILLERDPGYLANLHALPLVDRERLLKGNWKIKPSAGKVFNRGWFEIVDAAPVGGVECRFWDFASTAKKLAGDDPDFTAGVRVRLFAGTYYVTDCITFQEGPAQVEKQFVNISEQDNAAAKEHRIEYRARWEVEPGAAAKRDSRRLVQLLAGLDARGVPSRGDKITRAKGLAAQAEAGNVKLVKGHWNEEWLTHMHNQPDADHDDIMDGSSGAFNDLTTAKREAKSYQG